MARKVRLVKTDEGLVLIVGKGRQKLYGFKVVRFKPKRGIYTKLDDGLWLTDTIMVVARQPAQVIRTYFIEDWVLELLYSKYKKKLGKFLSKR